MKKIVLLIIFAGAVIGLTVWLAHYFSTGTIIVTASRNDTITLQKVSGNKPFVRIGKGKLSAEVDHGRYTATVKNGSKTTVQTIDFKSGHRVFQYSLAANNLLKPEFIVNSITQSLVATPGEVVYLNSFSQGIYTINEHGSVQKIKSDIPFISVKWGGSFFGVGETEDKDFYTIENGVVSPLSIPFTPSDYTVSYDKKIYLASGSDIYAGNKTGGFKKIYKAGSSQPYISAGVNGMVAVSDAQYGGKANNISKPLLAILDGAAQKKTKTIEAERIAWSPNSQHLVVVNQNSPTIYNVELEEVDMVPTNHVVGQFTWLSDSVLLYTLGNQLWSYNTKAQRAELLAELQSTASFSGLYVRSDGAYLYISVSDPLSSNHSIQRIDLSKN